MARLTPQQIADKQVKRAAASVGDYKDGVMGVKIAPTQLAAQAVDKYAAGVQAAVSDGTFVDGCNSVSLSDWQSATANKGGARYADGVRQAAGKIADFQAAIAPHRDAVQQQVKAMPSTTLEDRLARMEANARGMAKFTYRKKR